MTSTLFRLVNTAAAVAGLALVFSAAASAEKTSALETRSSMDHLRGPGEVRHVYEDRPIRSARRSAALADTITAGVPAGTPLIVALPEAPNTTYSVLRAPAHSWLIQRSFMWKTASADSGRHVALFERNAGGSVDTLYLSITIE